jgi:hypothetical protein
MYSVTVDSSENSNSSAKKLPMNLTYQQAASYAAKVIRSTSHDSCFGITVWDSIKEAVVVTLIPQGHAIVHVDADVYATFPRETAYIETAVKNALRDWKSQRRPVS